VKIQIKNISSPAVFKVYSQKYNIFRDVYETGLLGLEIRDVKTSDADDIHKLVLSGNEICYKNISDGENNSSIFIPGAIGSFKKIGKKIVASGNEDAGYKILNTIKKYEAYDSLVYAFGSKTFDFKKNYVMGILNVTPDSFSDGGAYFDSNAAVKKALEMIEEGADIIDIGGESTRPGAELISVDEEIKRVIPVIQSIIGIKKDVVISVDTNKSIVAEAALQSGAAIINDISGLTFDKEMTGVVKKYNAGLIIMHIKGTPKNMQDHPFYDDLIEDIYNFLYSQSELAKSYKINNIIIDPGIGFGKTVDDNFEILRRLDDFKTLGYPILTGVSRKTFLGKTFGLEVGERDTASAITDALALKNGAKIIRTHNVKFGRQAATLAANLF
jgi:dihydropteroate synthase